MRPKKVWGEMMARTTSIIMQNFDACRRESTECDVFHNAPQITVAGDLVALLQQEIATVFVGRFSCGLQRFFWEEKPFTVKGTDLKIVARWRYDMCRCRNARENL